MLRLTSSEEVLPGLMLQLVFPKEVSLAPALELVDLEEVPLVPLEFAALEEVSFVPALELAASEEV